MGTPNIWDVQRFVAYVAIGPSTLRNQGACGMARAASQYLEGIGLKAYSVASEPDFHKRLEQDTDRLQRKFPSGGQNWGSARKALNVFLRDAYYNYYLRKHFDLGKSEEYYEIPLDSNVVRALKDRAPTRSLPGWTSIKGLKPEVNRSFQAFAREQAHKEGLARVHMDALLWPQE